MKKSSILLISILSLTACQSTDSAYNINDGSQKQEINSMNSNIPLSFSNFTDIPIPQGSRMATSSTKIFGEGESWMGTLALNSDYKLGGLFDFYTSQMEKFGWTKLSVIRGEETILNYVRGPRIATVYLEDRTFGGTRVSFTVSPIPGEMKKAFSTRVNEKATEIATGTQTSSYLPTTYSSKSSSVAGTDAQNKQKIASDHVDVISPIYQDTTDKSQDGKINIGAPTKINGGIDSKRVNLYEDEKNYNF